MNKLKNNNGIALVLSLTIMMFMVTFGSILLLRVFTQKKQVDREVQLIRSHYLAEAGLHMGLNRLNRLVNAHLLNTVHTTPPEKVSADIKQYYATNNSIKLLADYTIDIQSPQFIEENALAVHTSIPVIVKDGQYQYEIRIKQKGTPSLVDTETWDFLYYYIIESTGTIGSTVQTTSCSGDFRIRIQRVSFAKSILFQNASFSTPNQDISFVASSNDITDKITWQEGQP